MIFYFKTNGHLVYNSQSEISQGSNGSNIVYVIAPFSFSSQVSASILLPNGKKIINQYLTRRKDLSAEYFSIDEVGLNVWSFDIPYSITRLTGTMIMQFAFTSSTETITTESVSIAIKQGVVGEEEIDISDSNILEEIKSYVALALEKVDDCERKLDKVDNVTNTAQAYVKNADGTQGVLSISTSGANDIIKRKRDGNITVGSATIETDAVSKGYVDGKVQEFAQSHYTAQQVDTILQDYQPMLQVGNGLAKTNNTISLENKIFEHYKNLIVGYSVLSTQPSDWATNYTAYYKNTGTDKEPTYIALTKQENFIVNQYYSFNENGANSIQGIWFPVDTKSVLIMAELEPVTSGSLSFSGYCMLGDRPTTEFYTSTVEAFSTTSKTKAWIMIDVSDGVATVTTCGKDKKIVVDKMIFNNSLRVNGLCLYRGVSFIYIPSNSVFKIYVKK